MKNFLLFLVLGGLITFTYFYEEVGKKEEESQNLKGKQLAQIKSSDVTKVILPHTTLEKKGENWWVTNPLYLADNLKVEALLLKITKLHKLSSLEGIEQTTKVMDNPLTINIITNQHKLELSIGQFIESTGNFYAKNDGDKNKVFITKDTSTFEGFYKNEKELLYQKYLSFKEVMNARPLAFFDRQIFRTLNYTKIQKVVFKGKKKDQFTVNFKSNLTEPLAPNGISYFPFQKFSEKNISLFFNQVDKKKKQVLAKKIKEITFYFKDKSQRTYTLYNEMDGQLGFFITDDLNDQFIFKVKSKEVSLFFLDVQDFWVKRINYGVDFQSFSKLTFKMKVKNLWENFYVRDIEKFVVQTNSQSIKKIQTEPMNFVMNLVLNLTIFKEAKKVIKGDEKNIESKKGFKLPIKIFGKSLVAIFLNNEVLLVNKSDSYTLLYSFNKIPFKLNGFEDIFLF